MLVALVKLASFGGYMLLVRSSFFAEMPIALADLLERSTITKVGQDVGNALVIGGGLDVSQPISIDYRHQLAI